jgi:hypothetical protein
MSDKPTIDWDADDAGFDEAQDRAHRGPEGPSEAGDYASEYDHEERPRRVQMNVTIAEEVKEAFRDQVKADNRKMQFVVEDLLRLYLREQSSD